MVDHHGVLGADQVELFIDMLHLIGDRLTSFRESGLTSSWATVSPIDGTPSPKR